MQSCNIAHLLFGEVSNNYYFYQNLSNKFSINTICNADIESE
jgi:hypothetical protein